MDVSGLMSLPAYFSPNLYTQNPERSFSIPNVCYSVTHSYNFSKAETFGVRHKVKLQLLPDVGLEEKKKILSNECRRALLGGG